jgi:hypothetical protein
MPANPRESYPVLKPGHEIHLTPIGGTLFALSAPIKVSPDIAHFLSCCDGRHKLGKAIPSSWSGDWEDLKFVGFVAMRFVKVGSRYCANHRKRRRG